MTVGLWGWMSAFGPGEMTEIEGRLTSHQYVDILEHVMLPSVRAMLIPPPQQIYIAMDQCSQAQLPGSDEMVQKPSRGGEDFLATQVP